jgi:hypothetical protein
MSNETQSEGHSEAITGYCVKCRAHQPILDVCEYEAKEKLGVKGRCGVCGCGMFKFIGSKSRNRPEGYSVMRARERRLERRKAKLLDGVPPIRAAYISDQEDPNPRDCQ